MFTKFFNLDRPKQQRIVNAAMKEFAQKGYENASTNEIVKEASISKGLLFHYFKNKKQLYLFLHDHCIELLTNEFFRKIDLSETDFFMRVRQSMLIKMELLYQYPDLFTFMESVYMEDAAEVKADLDKRRKELTLVNMNKIFEGIDFSRFRDDIDVQKALKIIIWTFEQFGEEALHKAKLSSSHEVDYEKVFAEANEYFHILIKCFYK
ncbi:MAG: TetR/AcrR family transcriptional regulator [Ectobacillus sp.]